MDDTALEIILNLFPNIQSREEFYIDIVNKMSLSSSPSVGYINMSEENFRRKSGILCLSNKPTGDKSLAIDISTGLSILTIGDKIVINKNKCYVEKDLDNKKIRLASSDSKHNESVVSGVLSGLDNSVSSLKQLEKDNSEEHKNSLYTVVPYLNKTEGQPAFYSYHWSLPEEVDYFFSTLTKDDKDKVKLETHPRAQPLSAIEKDAAKREESELTPEEFQKHIGISHNAVAALPVPDESLHNKARRFYIPRSELHSNPGYIRYHLDKLDTNHPWNVHKKDLDTLMYIIALAEVMHGTGQQVDPKSLEEFMYSISGRRKDLQNWFESKDKGGGGGRDAIESKKRVYESFFKQVPQLSEKQRETITDPTKILTDNRALLVKFLKVKANAKNATEAKPYRTMELMDKKRINYFDNIEAMSKIHEIDGVKRSAVDHLVSDGIKLLIQYKPKVNEVLDSENPITEEDKKELGKNKLIHDNLVLLYLSRKLGLRPQSDDSRGLQGLTTLRKSNIIDRGESISVSFKGKGKVAVSKIITDPLTMHLIRDQVAQASKLEKLSPIGGSENERSEDTDPRLFTGPGANFINILKTSVMPDSFTRLGLQNIIPYNFRHYRAVEFGVEEVRKEAFKKLKEVFDKVKKEADPEKKKRLLSDQYKLIPDMLTHFDPFESKIIDKINEHLNHRQGSASWQKYVSYPYLTTAYREALKEHLQRAYKEI
mgnify:CR=1 FL=1